MSQPVSDFLLRLPLDEAEAELTPTVRRLLGIARGADGVDEYHAHLVERYRR